MFTMPGVRTIGSLSDILPDELDRLPIPIPRIHEINNRFSTVIYDLELALFTDVIQSLVDPIVWKNLKVVFDERALTLYRYQIKLNPENSPLIARFFLANALIAWTLALNTSFRIRWSDSPPTPPDAVHVFSYQDGFLVFYRQYTSWEYEQLMADYWEWYQKTLNIKNQKPFYTKI